VIGHAENRGWALSAPTMMRLQIVPGFGECLAFTFARITLGQRIAEGDEPVSAPLGPVPLPVMSGSPGVSFV
jgi:hypothetical protein